MSTTITNEHYTSRVRKEIAQTITLMLIGNFCFLEGAQKIADLRHEAAVEEFDHDFMVFVAIASEADYLPIGKIRANWQVESLERHQPEIDSVTKWAREIGEPACRSILARFTSD